MKHLTTLLLLFIFTLISCQKEKVSGTDTYLQNVQSTLKDSVSSSVYAQMDFTRAIRTSLPGDTTFLRIPFQTAKLENEFVLLQTTAKGSIVQGRIVSMKKNLSAAKEKPYHFNGFIELRTLKGTVLTESPIVNGYITALHPNVLNMRIAVVPSPEYVELPEVVVVASYSSGGISYSDWAYLEALFGGGGSPTNCFYSSMDGSGGGGGGGSSDGGYYSGGGGGYTGGSSDGVYDSPTILVDFEYQQGYPGIELQKYLNCFNSIPDAGANCSIELFADIPVDSDPNKLFNWDTESPGHCYIQLKKSNGAQSVLQNIGFYPQTNWKVMLTPAPVDGKFVDNSGHEFNASIKMTVSPENFKSILTEIQYLANFIRYDIDEYNCTDFAMDVFNKIRTDKLSIPMYEIPGGMTVGGTRTPQGVYNKLRQMKVSGHPEADNIQLPGYKGWVANSKGPCN